MSRSQPKPEPDQFEPDGPAVISELHAWDRPATDDQMRPILGKVACRKWTPLQAAYERGKLGPRDSGAAISRLDAGQAYSTIWDAAQSPGRDSTQALNVSRSTGGGGISQAQTGAIRLLLAIDSHMGRCDRIIIRMVCGEGYFPSEAVRMISADYAKATAVRFREALDELIGALAKANRNPGMVNMRYYGANGRRYTSQTTALGVDIGP